MRIVSREDAWKIMEQRLESMGCRLLRTHDKEFSVWTHTDSGRLLIVQRFPNAGWDVYAQVSLSNSVDKTFEALSDICAQD